MKKLIRQVAVGGRLRAQGGTGSLEAGRSVGGGGSAVGAPGWGETTCVVLFYCTSGMSWKSALESSVPMDRAMK